MINKIKRAVDSLTYAILLFLPQEFSKYRVRYFNKKGCWIDPTSTIAPNVRIKGKFTMGKRSSIAQNCSISGESSGIFIGDYVMIAPNVSIVAFNHGYKDLKTPMLFQANEEDSVIIEDNVWIASNCTIAKGVRIGEGSIIGANSFVNKNIPPFTIAGGVPAKIIKRRND